VKLERRKPDAKLVARFQLEFLQSLTVKVDIVLGGDEFLNDNLAALDDQLDVLTGNLIIPRNCEPILWFASDPDHITVVDLLTSLFSVLTRNCYQFEHVWPFRHDAGLRRRFLWCVRRPGYAVFARNRKRARLSHSRQVGSGHFQTNVTTRTVRLCGLPSFRSTILEQSVGSGEHLADHAIVLRDQRYRPISAVM
jgi:hypothetical protein